MAGLKTELLFKVEPADRLQKYLGAWAHMLAVSQDLVDMIHAHPNRADGAGDIQFKLIFPRPGIYRVWVQVQRDDKVSAVPFTIQVSDLGSIAMR